MAAQNVLYLKSQIISLERYRQALRPGRPILRPVDTYEPRSDCWPDNADGENPVILPDEVMKANSAKRVLLEFAAILSVCCAAAIAANLLI